MNKQYQLTGRTNHCLINKLRKLVNLGKPFFSNPNSQKLLWGTSQKTPCITFLRRFPPNNLRIFPHTLCPEPICCRFRRTLLSSSSRLGPSSQSTRPRSARLLNFCCSAFFTRSFEVCSTRTLLLSVCTAFLRRKHF